MSYTRILTNFTDNAGAPFEGALVAFLTEAIALQPEGENLTRNRTEYPVVAGVAYQDHTKAEYATLPTTTTSDPPDVAVSLYLKDAAGRLEYYGAFVIPEEDGGPVDLADLTGVDPSSPAGVSVVRSLGGVQGTIALAGNAYELDPITKTLTLTAMVHHGAYDAEVAYKAGDVAEDLGGGWWLALRSSTGAAQVEGADWTAFPAGGGGGAAGTMVFKGAYNAASTYNYGEVVEDTSGVWWYALANGLIGVDPAEGASWTRVGPAIASGDLAWEGEYAPATTYPAGSLVYHNGRLWQTPSQTTGEEPGSGGGGGTVETDACDSAGGAVVGMGSTSGHGIANAFDGDDGTYWEADSNTGMYNAKGVENVWGVSRSIKKLRMLNDAGWQYRPGGVLLYGTTDGSTWTLLPDPDDFFANGAGENVLVFSTEHDLTGIRVLSNQSTTSGGGAYNWRIYSLEAIYDAAGGGGTPAPWEQLVGFKRPVYALASVPAAATAGTGAEAIVTGSSRGTRPIYCDGADWRFHSDDAVLS